MAASPKPTVLVIESSAKAALPVIESMAAAGIRVICASNLRYNTGFYSRGCRERHVYPSPRYEPDAFKAWLLVFVSRRRVDLLFPIGHYGAARVSEIQDEIRRHTRLILPPHDIFLKGYEKIPTLKAATAAGVAIPETWYPADHADGVEAVLPQVKSWPILIKPSVGVGARGIIWCHSAEDVRRQFDAIQQQHGECFLQDFVPPGGMQYKADLLVDDKQARLAAIVYGKTRMYPPDGGSSVLNFSADRPDILDAADRVLKHLGWVGFCDFDFVVDPRDNAAKLMEINPRFPESMHMGTSVGIDFPKMIFEMAMGLPVAPVLDYPKDRFLRFMIGDLLWFLRVDNRRRFSTWPSWFKFFDRKTAYQIERMSDLGPIMGYLLENLYVLITDRRLRQERLRLKSGKSPSSP